MRKEIFESNNVRWIHINKPSKEDIKFLKTSFGFHPLIIESVDAPTLHPAVEDYGDHLFLILHFPVIFREHIANKAAEVDFLVTKNLLCTVSYHSYERLEGLFEKLQQDEGLRAKFSDHHTGPLVYGILDWLLGSLIQDLDFIEAEVTRIENKIFHRQGTAMVEDISHARRDILDFRRTLLPSETVLKHLPGLAKKFYGEAMEPYFADLITTESKIQHLIENHKETIESLQATHDALLSSKISRIITVLTVFSSVILPINFLASIWGMNHAQLPLRDGPYDFWIVVGIMAAFSLLLIAYFRRKGWV